ncbi:hypothetical protein OHU17_27375 [Streptomyces goshikiensis]|uniref:Uncharacterized protein n=2 Tax=Streptomyces TaxID=1883 RepID=A0ABZ1RSD1_9ACTN|nr:MULTISPECIES: hypothetical protein [Streptomyces]EDX25708.1 hypothetical protein SSAG_05324 [Streptomyces sp. Mg1]RPK37269.1 hypothetical protein EES37_25225 [Streptomyces sp. ADI91-18]WBY19552.1 hypothetical protein PET44_07850 [Streptomyces goshikiensis]WSY00629.1 hypothetical protein OG590_27380 [Streptomyces goshikiensis]
MGSFEEEWARLRGGPSGEPGMRLASVPAADGGGGGGGGGGDADVQSTRPAWTAAGTAVGGLAGDVKKALTGLETGQTGLAAKGAVESAGAQSEVYASWKTYLEALSGRCTALQGKLERAGNDLFLTDDNLNGLFTELAKQYQDTPATGGQER